MNKERPYIYISKTMFNRYLSPAKMKAEDCKELMKHLWKYVEDGSKPNKDYKYYDLFTKFVRSHCRAVRKFNKQ